LPSGGAGVPGISAEAPGAGAGKAVEDCVTGEGESLEQPLSARGNTAPTRQEAENVR